jgi:aspartate racemase
MSRNMSKIIGIIGGMGPEATLKLFEYLIYSKVVDNDSGHPRIIIDSNSKIPDRNKYLLGYKDAVNPTGELVHSARTLQNAGADILLLPCLTAHYFISEIQKEVDIPILDMIETVLLQVRKLNITRVGLLATKTTYSKNIFDSYVDKPKFNINLILPDEPQQDVIHEIIYSIKRRKINTRDYFNLAEISNSLMQKGAEMVILGCTDLPVLNLQEPYYIDILKYYAEEVINLDG